MTGLLLRVSWRVVAQPPMLIPASAAALLALATAPFLNAGDAHQVRTGVGTLLACALAATAEDPVGEVAAASPRRCWQRCGSRLLLGLALTLPVAILSLGLVEHQVGTTPLWGSAVQVLAILVIGPAIGFAVWGWGDMAQPTYAAMAGVLCFTLALLPLPTGWAVLELQPWGPPWEAALIRWCALIALGAAIVASAWQDPFTRRSAVMSA